MVACLPKKRNVAAKGCFSVFYQGKRVTVGLVDFCVPRNSVLVSSSPSPELYGKVELFDSFFKLVNPSTNVFLGVWISSSSFLGNELLLKH